MLKIAYEIRKAMDRLGFEPGLYLLAMTMAEKYGVWNTIAAMELEAESGFNEDFEDILMA